MGQNWSNRSYWQILLIRDGSNSHFWNQWLAETWQYLFVVAFRFGLRQITYSWIVSSHRKLYHFLPYAKLRSTLVIWKFFLLHSFAFLSKIFASFCIALSFVIHRSLHSTEFLSFKFIVQFVLASKKNYSKLLNGWLLKNAFLFRFSKKLECLCSVWFFIFCQFSPIEKIVFNIFF